MLIPDLVTIKIKTPKPLTTLFRDDLSPSFIAQFAVLLFLKAFHWLLEDRIDYMERSPVIGFFFHLRALSLMSILAVCDAFLLSYAGRD